MKTKVIMANRDTIAEKFNTDQLTTHRILMNLNWGFFLSHFPENPEEAWWAAHPEGFHNGISLDFIEQFFEVFATEQFTTSAGWEFNEQKGVMEWKYKSYYRKEPIILN